MNTNQWWESLPLHEWIDIQSIPKSIFPQVWEKIEKSNVDVNSDYTHFMIARRNVERKFYTRPRGVIRSDGMSFNSVSKAAKVSGIRETHVVRSIEIGTTEGGFVFKLKPILGDK